MAVKYAGADGGARQSRPRNGGRGGGDPLLKRVRSIRNDSSYQPTIRSALREMLIDRILRNTFP